MTLVIDEVKDPPSLKKRRAPDLKEGKWSSLSKEKRRPSSFS